MYRQHPDGRVELGVGRNDESAMWGWWFCDPCNQEVTDRWERPTYDWNSGLDYVLTATAARPGQRVQVTGENVDAGAFVRALWGWVFAVDQWLRAAIPEVASAVLCGDPIEPPARHRLLVAATRDDQMWIAGGDEPPTYPVELRAVVSVPPLLVNVVTGARGRSLTTWTPPTGCGSPPESVNGSAMGSQ